MNSGGVNIDQEVSYLQKVETQTKKELEKERSNLNKVAQRIYSLWKEIVEIREANEFPYTNYDLKVHQGEDGKDVLFNLVNRGGLVSEDHQWKVDNFKATAIKTSVYC